MIIKLHKAATAAGIRCSYLTLAGVEQNTFKPFVSEDKLSVIYKRPLFAWLAKE